MKIGEMLFGTILFVPLVLALVVLPTYVLLRAFVQEMYKLYTFVQARKASSKGPLECSVRSNERVGRKAELTESILICVAVILVVLSQFRSSGANSAELSNQGKDEARNRGYLLD